MRATFVELNGCRTRYLSGGSGRPLLLLHGFGGSADNWLRNIDPLGQDFTVHAPDLLGQGFTSPVDIGTGPPHPWILQHLTRLVEHLKLDRFAVVGQSFGALMAALLYFEMPGRITHLVLVGSASLLNTDAELTTALSRVRADILAVLEDPALERCRQHVAKLVLDPASIPDALLLARLTAYALPTARDSYDRALRGMMDLERARPYRVLDRLEEIAVPTLLVWGRQDPLGRYERALEAVTRLPRGRLVTFEDCGHLPYLEQPERFNRAVRDFVTS